MSLHVIEGAWEEIERRKEELIGRRLRVIIAPERPAPHTTAASPDKAHASRQPKQLVGFGAFKDALPSTDEYLREKRADIEREERGF